MEITPELVFYIQSHHSTKASPQYQKFSRKSQVELAKETGLSTATIHSIQNGTWRAPASDVVAVQRGYGGRPRYVFTDEQVAQIMGMGLLEAARTFKVSHMTIKRLRQRHQAKEVPSVD